MKGRLHTCQTNGLWLVTLGLALFALALPSQSLAQRPTKGAPAQKGADDAPEGKKEQVKKQDAARQEPANSKESQAVDLETRPVVATGTPKHPRQSLPHEHF